MIGKNTYRPSKTQDEKIKIAHARTVPRPSTIAYSVIGAAKTQISNITAAMNSKSSAKKINGNTGINNTNATMSMIGSPTLASRSVTLFTCSESVSKPFDN